MRLCIFGLGMAMALCAGCAGDPGPVEGAGPPRHVFLVVIDTLRADHLGCYGYNRRTSPTIDRLAREGVVFENAVSTSSNTLESVISLFTSTTGLTTKVYHEGIPARYESLQVLFAAGGFNTLAVIANPWLKYHEGFFSAGFGHYKFINDERPDYWGANTTKQVTDKVLQFLDQGFDPDGRNFFYVHYLDPHDAYRSPVEYGFTEAPRPDPVPLVHVYSGEEAIQTRAAEQPDYHEMATPHPLPPGLLDFFIAAYDEEIRYVDEQLTRILEKLQGMGVLEDSLIIVTSDHGEEFMDHGLLKHGFQLYRETVEVPLIVHGPRFLRPGRERRVVSAIDIAPTMLGISGIAVPDHMLGTNLFAEPNGEPAMFCTHFVNQSKRGMRYGRWKVVEDLHEDTMEVYDLARDSRETSDLSDDLPPEWPDVWSRYQQALKRHAPRESEPRRDSPEMDEETREQLKALGYVQ